MTTITIDRSLLEQALDVLITRGAQPGYETERAWLKTVKSLEAALSAPATALEQHRPFVPWSKEAEMVASWAATALEAELAATETVITEYRQQCLDNATEIARLRSESEERLQNCAALVAENERLRAAPATAPAQPAWHDVPTEPGTWILSLDSGMEVQENITQHEIDIEATWPGGRWYGPIPEDKL